MSRSFGAGEGGGWFAWPPPPASGVRRAVAGGVAAALSLAVASLITTLLPDGVSPVIAVGDAVVALTPSGSREPAIRILGTSDKTFILIAVTLITIGAGALLGLASRRDRRPLLIGGGVLALLGLAATAASSPSGVTVGALALVGAGLAAVVAVRILTRPAAPPPLADAAPVPVPPGRGSEATYTRREFTVRAGAVALAALLTQGLASWIGNAASSAAQAVGSRIRLPRVPSPLPPPSAADAFDLSGITPLVTPNDDFYRVDTAFFPPSVDPTTWKLTIDGMVKRQIALGYEEVLAAPQVEADITLTCVSDEVGGNLVSNARWQGVRLDYLLGLAGVLPGATQVVGRSVDGFTAGFPTAAALDGRPAMVAVGMNGQPLPVGHGFPARLVVPGLYGYVSATKWLSEITLTTFAAFRGYWVQQGWNQLGTIVTESRIDIPQQGANLPAGRTVIAGIAWAQNRGIQAVQVSVDNGAWSNAELAGQLSIDTWRQWRFFWDATPGSHTITARAVDDTGTLQTGELTGPFPGPATGWPSVQVSVQ